MLRSGNAHAGIAATTSTTKGGEDTTNSQSELDSLPNTDDESQGSKPDTDSEAHRSDDQQYQLKMTFQLQPLVPRWKITYGIPGTSI